MVKMEDKGGRAYFCEELKRFREIYGVSQELVAKAMEIPKRTYIGIETEGNSATAKVLKRGLLTLNLTPPIGLNSQKNRGLASLTVSDIISNTKYLGPVATGLIDPHQECLLPLRDPQALTSYLLGLKRVSARERAYDKLYVSIDANVPTDNLYSWHEDQEQKINLLSLVRDGFETIDKRRLTASQKHGFSEFTEDIGELMKERFEEEGDEVFLGYGLKQLAANGVQLFMGKRTVIYQRPARIKGSPTKWLEPFHFFYIFATLQTTSFVVHTRDKNLTEDEKKMTESRFQNIEKSAAFPDFEILTEEEAKKENLTADWTAIDYQFDLAWFALANEPKEA